METNLTAARFDTVKPIGAADKKSTKGFFASRSAPSPFAVFTFRGTDRDDTRNAITDADLFPQQRDGYIVHRGFALALDQVWADEIQPLVTDFLKSHPGAPVYFAGHSLGAALATIAVTRFDGGKSILYTIGSPRVGDEQFVKVVLAKSRLAFRFVNSQDIVTQIPHEFPLKHYYRHVGFEKYIDRKGDIHDHPSEFDKAMDVAQGTLEHDRATVLAAIGDPAKFLAHARKAALDPPPYIVGNHTPARYSIRIWNHYSGR